METNHLIATSLNTYFPHPIVRHPQAHFYLRRIATQIRSSRFVLYSKKSQFQDFQEYAKPSRLLPATNVEVCTDSSFEKVVGPSSKVGPSESLYKIKLKTSSFYGSGLTDVNAGILICLIDENGESILQRIPATSVIDGDKVVSEVLHFQRGSVDEFTFGGPKLGKIDAVWISVESGQWRLRDMTLSVISCSQPLVEENDQNDLHYAGFQFDFVADDTLLGEGGEIPMIELRPRSVKEFSGDKSTLLTNNPPQSFYPGTPDNISNEESMKEYADLKSSLLLYDAILILAGSIISSLTAGENNSIAFVTGGVGGFLYLLLLQRSVDGLPSPALDSEESEGYFGQFLENIKGSVSTLVLAFGFAVIAVKLGSRDGDIALSPKEIVFGMMGFLACKVAVLLAAFKPMQVGLKENK